jgi:hypothetical protein
MIYQDYEIWTFNGWQRVGNLTKSDKVMIYDLRRRISNFGEIKNLKSIITEKKIFENTNYNFIFCNKNNFLDEKYKIVKPNNDVKILCEHQTFWHIENISELNEKVKFITFDLEPFEFVFVKNIIPLYIGWDNLGSDNLLKDIDKGSANRAKIKSEGEKYARKERVRKVN